MANTKEYSIKINGLQETVKQVDALSDSLQFLEQRIKNLEGKAVNLGGGSGASSTKALQEQDKLLKQIQETEQKIRDARREDYQSLLAQKDILKDATESAKERAAAERLSTKSYANTMKGMKEELADIKKVMQSTDLGSDKFKQLTNRANDLNNKLKEIEQAYGQFGRNVGNYQSAFDGMKKFKVQVGDVTREFNSAREASRTLRQELLGLEDQGTKQAQDLREAISEVDSAIKDATVSSQAMDTAMDWMQSFVSLAQAGQGIAAFFGVDDSKMQQTIKDLLAIQNAVNGIEKILKQVQSKEGIGEYFGKAFKSIDEFSEKLLKVKKTSKETAESVSTQAKQTNKLTTATQGATAAEGAQATANVAVATTSTIAAGAARLLSFALKAIGIGIALEAIALLVEGIKSAASAIYDFFSDAEEEADKLNNKVNSLITSTDNMMKIYDEAVNRGEITKTQALIEKYKVQEKLLNGLISTLQNLKKEDAFKEMGEDGEKYLKFLEDITTESERFSKAQEDLEKNVDGASTRLKFAEASIRSLFKTFSTDFSILNASKHIQTFTGDLQIFADVAKEAEQRMEWLFMNLNSVAQAAQEGQAAIDKFTKTDAERQKEELKKERDTALQYAKTEEEKNKIREGYRKKEKEIDAAEAKRKQQEYETQQREVEQRNTTLENLKLRLMKDGLAKRLVVLDNEKRATIAKLKDNHDAQLKAEKAYLEIRQQTIDKFFKEVEAKELEYSKLALENNKKIADYNLKIYQDKAKDKSEEEPAYVDIAKRDENNTLKENYGRRIVIIKDFYKEHLTTLKAYYDKIQEYEAAEAEIEKQNAVIELNKKYDAERETIDNRIEDLKKVLDKEVDVNSETYQKVNEKYEQALQDRKNIEILYKKEEEVINDEYNAKLKEAQKNHLENIKNISLKSWSLELTNLRDYLNEANQLIGNQPIMIKGWEIINLPKTKRDLKEAKEAIEEVLDVINEDFKTVQRDHDNGLISDADFNATVKNLYAIGDQASNALRQVNEDISQLGADFYGSIDRWVQEVGQAASSILSSVSEIIKNNYEEQISELEKDIDEYEKLLDKQEEITQQHADKINSIEDELKTARGDRRQELIDNLNAELAAQRASLEQKKKIEKEEKRLDYEKQVLEWEAAKKEHEINLWQAAVNAAMAVSMAAVNKWPIPAIPMMALAAAVGAAQLAAVASTPLPEKPTPKYANGGVLEGASHAQGGIKVLGGQAEVEGGEYITNRQTTSSNVELLDFINSKRRRVDISDMIEFYNGNTRRNLQANKYKFADGGQLPMLRNDISLNNEVINAMNAYANKPTVVQVVDIVDATDNLNKVKVLSGLLD